MERGGLSFEQLADRLDTAARGSLRTVRVLPVQGVNPALVQQAVDFVQGRTGSPAGRTGR